MTNRKVTIYEVAATAGVSISTVSLALNSPARVSQRTRDRVLHAADTLGFVPKSEAVTRARRALGRVGVVAPFTSYPSFARRLNGVLACLRDEALDVVVFDQESAATSPSPLLATLPLTRRLDGMIVMALPLEDSTADRLISLELPTVLVDTADDRFDSVQTDDYAGGRMVAEHLLARGHTRLAFMGERQRSHLYESPSERRLRGFREALTAAGHPLTQDRIRLSTHGTTAAYEQAHELLTSTDPPTAVFAHDDTLAAGVLRTARELHVPVAEELAVVGFDDGDLAEALDLTTVRQPLEESGEAAAQLLLDRMARTTGPTRNVDLRLTLVARGTS